MLWLMMLVIIAAPLLSILLWFRFGRDPQVVRTVEFYSPEGVTPAELGYIIDGAVDSKDVVSLIIYWANGGYLTIREDEEKKFTLIKKKDLPDSVPVHPELIINSKQVTGPATTKVGVIIPPQGTQNTSIDDDGDLQIDTLPP
jgi:hypothetical protein